MLQKLKNLFFRNDLDDQRAFQSRIVSFVSKNFPALEVQIGDDPLMIDCQGKDLPAKSVGLHNLYQTFLLTAKTNADLELLAKEHFDKLLGLGKMFEEDLGNFEKIKERVFAQLMPTEYTRQFDALALPFSDEVLIGFVVDGEGAYRYITDDDLAGWEINITDVKRAAFENLVGISNNIEMTLVPEPNSMIALNTLDGFDAVRIILPDFQRFCKEKLGPSFYFGIPNRDFLICWAKDAEPEFQSKIISQIRNDFAEMPYSLSEYHFELLPDGEISKVKIDRQVHDRWVKNK
jgi:hypothetical protein